jgi:hypothetical protein
VIFASIRVSQIPWRSGQRVKLHATALNGKQASVVVRDLRQHNEPNPILASIRAQGWGDMNEAGKRNELAEWLWWLSDESHNIYRFQTRPHIDHARRVLTRLDRLTEGA